MRASSMVLLLLASPALAAKKPKPAEAKQEASATPVVTEAPGADGLLLQTVDLDADGRVDINNHLFLRPDGSKVLRLKEVDLDRDGRFDLRSEFDAAGELVTEQMDGDFDGRFDWVDHYKAGQRVMAEHDANFDGRTDTWFYYLPREGGGTVIDRKERDTNGDGKVDVWERFDGRGNVVRTGRDIDGDGVMDERDE